MSPFLMEKGLACLSVCNYYVERLILILAHGVCLLLALSINIKSSRRCITVSNFDLVNIKQPDTLP